MEDRLVLRRQKEDGKRRQLRREVMAKMD